MKPSLVSVVRQRASYDPSLIRRGVIAADGELGLSWSDIVRPGDRVLLKLNFTGIPYRAPQRTETSYQALFRYRKGDLPG